MSYCTCNALVRVVLAMLHVTPEKLGELALLVVHFAVRCGHGDVELELVLVIDPLGAHMLLAENQQDHDVLVIGGLDAWLEPPSNRANVDAREPVLVAT